MSRPIRLWPSISEVLEPDVAYIVLNHEKAVEVKSGRRPSNRPVLYFPNTGAIRVEFLGTFDSVTKAKLEVETILGD